MCLTVWSLHDPGLIPCRGKVFQGIFPWLVTLNHSEPPWQENGSFSPHWHLWTSRRKAECPPRTDNSWFYSITFHFVFVGIIENLTEYRPEISHDVAQQGVLKWLLQRIRQKGPFDSNKLYATEILAILLQDNDDTRALLGEIDGIDILLQQLNVSDWI